MPIRNGVINIITGLLLRAGFCDFTTDGSFKPDIEAQYPDVPDVFFVVNDIINPDSPNITHWNGDGWDEVPRTGIE